MPMYGTKVPRRKQAKAYWDEGEWEWATPGRSDIDVIITEYDTFTGVYDNEGRELHRLKQPIGFLRE